ncbi:MAG: hypothetical protein H6592_13445, partial [Flavobacteriales bacterium]|nr:hypothetical protein [Flavobacteriales bacterium]
MANHPPTRGHAILAFVLFTTALQAQQGGGIHGNFSTDAQYYNVDSAIGAVV